MTDAVQQRYARFAEQEAPGRSDLYVEWAEGVAADSEMQAILARIPENRRQPPLVFAVTRMLGSGTRRLPGLAGVRAWRTPTRSSPSALRVACRPTSRCDSHRCCPCCPRSRARSHCSRSAPPRGLCLYPDRYSYRFVGARRATARRRSTRTDGTSTVVLESRVDGRPPAICGCRTSCGVPASTSRPLDARDDRDRRWLQGLVWPGEDGREERVAAALDIAASDPPRLVAGDALERIDALAAEAPRDATLVDHDSRRARAHPQGGT